MEDKSWRDLAAHEGDLVADGMFRIEAPLDARHSRALRLRDRSPALITLLDADETLADQLVGPPPETHTPGCVEVWAHGMLAPGIGFMITPELGGSTLDDLLDEGPLEPARALAILLGIVRPLHAVHRSGHLLLNLRPQVIHVIADWGEERVQIPSVPWGIGPAAGQRILGYGAPEVDYTPDGTSDQFSLGVIAFELLTGFTPFNPEAVPGERTAIPALPAPGVPDAWVPVLDRLLSHRIRDRFPDCEVLAAALEDLQQMYGPADSSVGHFTPVITGRMAAPPTPVTDTAEPLPDEIVQPHTDSVLGYALLLLLVGVAALAMSYIVLQLW